MSKEPEHFPPLDAVTRPTVETGAAAFYLNRAEQTLRKWATDGNAPIQPRRINGRLAWPVSRIRELTGA